MTAWHSSTYNARLNSGLKFFKEQLEVAAAELKRGSLFFWSRIREKHPKFYLVFVIRNQNLQAFRFLNNKLTEQTTLSLAEEDRPHLLKYLEQFSNHPLKIIIQGGEADFRLVSLKNVRWWDRASLLKQVKLGEFTSTDWTQKLRIPSPEDPHRYLLTGVRPSSSLKNLLNFLSKQQNPIAGVQMWPVIAAEQTLKMAKETFPYTKVAKWSFIVLCQDNQQWQLIVCQDEAVVLSRQGFFSPLSSVDDGLSKEILATLRYLHRNGYQEGEAVTIIQCGFSEFLNLDSTIPTEVLQLPEIAQPQSLGLSYFSIFSALKLLNIGFLNPLSAKECSFEIPAIRSQRFAFLIPQLSIHLCIPLFILCLLFGTLFFAKGLQKNQLYTSLTSEISKVAITGEAQKKLKSAKLFQFYQSKTRPSPLLKLRSLTAPITPEGALTELKWRDTGTQAPSHNLKMLLTLNTKALEARAKKSGKKILGTQIYQQKIEKSLEKSNPTSHIEWQPSQKKNSLTLNISYE